MISGCDWLVEIKEGVGTFFPSNGGGYLEGLLAADKRI